MKNMEVLHNVTIVAARNKKAPIAVKFDADMVDKCLADAGTRKNMEMELSEIFKEYGNVTLTDNYWHDGIAARLERDGQEIELLPLSSGTEYIYADKHETLHDAKASDTIGAVLAKAFSINEKKKESKNMATKSNIPSIPADFKFTTLANVKMTGMMAKLAVSVHPQLVAKCENRAERIEQVQAALNAAFDGMVRKIELNIKESGDIKMRSVNLAGSTSTTILPADTTFYIYVDSRTDRVNVMPNLSQQWAELKREFAANGTPEYAYISPFAAGIMETTEEPEDEEIEERENMEGMDSRDAMIAALEAKLAAMEKANSDLAHKVMEVEESNRNLAEQVKAAENENKELADRVEAAEKENMELCNGYMELTAMIEKIEGNANGEESKAEESVTAQEQNEVIGSSTNNDPITTMDKHADAIAADMENISSRANIAKRSIESIAEKAATVRMETSQMVDKINAMQANKPDVGVLKARLSAHLAAPLEVEEANSGDCP